MIAHNIIAHIRRAFFFCLLSLGHAWNAKRVLTKAADEIGRGILGKTSLHVKNDKLECARSKTLGKPASEATARSQKRHSVQLSRNISLHLSVKGGGNFSHSS